VSSPAKPKRLDPRRRYCVGEVVAEKYLLEQMLGEGGMGTVWVARNMRLGSKVALKFIRPDLRVADADERLLDEARAQALLEHAAIAKVFDFGCTSEGAPFIVMELLEGRSLADVLAERRRVACTVACQILLPVIDALAFLHESGVVHRDLKPENIFLSHDGKRTQPKLVDFGVAKLEKHLAGTRSITEEGTVFGSPAYMAPEQARGCADADYRVDIWAISVVLFEAVTGDFAFQGNDYPALLRSVIEDDIAPPAELVTAFPGLFRIIRRGLEKDRTLRWQSMRDLGRAMAAWLLDQHVTTDIRGESLRDNWLGGGQTDGHFPSFLGLPAPSYAAIPLVRTVNPHLSTGPSSATSRIAGLPRKHRGARVAFIAATIAAGAVLLGALLASKEPGMSTTGVGGATLGREGTAASTGVTTTPLRSAPVIQQREQPADALVPSLRRHDGETTLLAQAVRRAESDRKPMARRDARARTRLEGSSSFPAPATSPVVAAANAPIAVASPIAAAEPVNDAPAPSPASTARSQDSVVYPPLERTTPDLKDPY